MNLRVFFIYICKTAHFGWLLFSGHVRMKPLLLDAMF